MPNQLTKQRALKRVAILAYPDVALFELSCAVELFGLPRPEFDIWYNCDVVSFHSEQVSSTAGVGLRIEQINALDDFDMLVVPSWPTNLTESHRTDIHKRLIGEIQRFVATKKRVLSFCSGAFLLAEAGVFKNGSATTHWQYADRFKQRFPEIEFADNVLYLYDGSIGCSAGSASGLDLGLEVIRQDFGYEIANQVARRLVISPHRKGGQSQYVETPVLEVPNQFASALDWAIEHLDEAINIDVLATHANMSRRTFDRKFRTSFNMSPKEWITKQRIEKAKSLLELEHLGIEKVAELSGFDNATTMRHHFRKVLGISPNHYRQQFAK